MARYKSVRGWRWLPAIWQNLDGTKILSTAFDRASQQVVEKLVANPTKGEGEIMRITKSVTALVLGLALSGGTVLAVHAQEGPPGRYWNPDEPQGNWSQAWHSGFHDGIEAAHHDIDAHRPPDPDRHDKFRHPDLPRDERGEFREGFRRGYQMVYDHDWHHHD
jgi:hypothetical protein